MAIAVSHVEANPLHLEGIVVAVDGEGVMLEVFDQKNRRSYHLFTPFGIMPPVLCNQIEVGSFVQVESWHDPEAAGRMFVSMSATIKK